MSLAPAPRKLAVLNNYSFARVQAEVRQGTKPAHHLYGIDALERAGWTVEPIEPIPGPWQARIFRWLDRWRTPWPLGDLAQQWECWRRRAEFSAIYAPCQTQHQLLAVARALGWLKIPIVALAHHPTHGGRLQRLREPWLRWGLAGVDAFPSLSAQVATDLNEQAGRPLSQPLAWGPDPDFPVPPPIYPGEGFLCAGRTGRDFELFGRAATQAGVAGEIICLQSSVSAAFGEFGPTVRVCANQRESDMDYLELGRRFAAARALAIPLTTTTTLAGLTSLTDALSAGKAVIMTAHPLIDLDLEKEGIGLTVAMGDEAGWRQALLYLQEHPEEATAMGRRARALVDAGKWSSRTFNAAMAAILEQVVRDVSPKDRVTN